MTTESKALATQQAGAVLEKVIIEGDLGKLSPIELVQYYRAVCESIGINPLTRPFDYIVLNGTLTLYANKSCAAQLREKNHISIDPPKIEYADDLILVAVVARQPDGRTDSELGVVAIGQLKGEAKANAIMKAITKAKRRVTLSIAGLGMLDETEVGSIPGARVVPASEVEAEVVEEVVFEDLDAIASTRKRVEDLIAKQNRTIAGAQKYVADEWGLTWEQMTVADWQKLEKILTTKK